MSGGGWLITGGVILAGLWLGPLPSWAAHSFTAHMVLHMGVVAVAAPLLTLGLAGGRWDPVRRWRGAFNPIVASMFELAVVWSWHAPALHEAARTQREMLVLEQFSFLVAGLWLWLAVCGGEPAHRAERAWTGVAGLLFTSIHMTLLGALFALAPRALYGMHVGPDALADQHLGGTLMLLIGGASYLTGALWLVRTGLADRAYRGGVA